MTEYEPEAAMHSFRAVETAAYCPRKLYYRKRSPAEETPEAVTRLRDLASAYETVLADERALQSAPIEVTPTQFRTQIGRARARLTTEEWNALCTPVARDILLTGRECRGRIHKLLHIDTDASDSTPDAQERTTLETDEDAFDLSDSERLSLSLVFAGRPPETGVWHAQSVRLMAAAKALSWECQTQIKRVFVEYPAYGVIREIAVDARRTAAYREAVRIADALDGPPGRTNNRKKCSPCEFQPQCGVRTRSLRSLLGRS